MRNLIFIVLAFLIIISFLIFSLINADKKIDSYFKINNQIIELMQTNRNIYQFSLNSIKYTNYDNIQYNINELKNIMNNIIDIKEHPLIKNTAFYKKSLIINELILEEIEIVQKLKSYNAVFNNSIRNIKILKSKITNSNTYDSIYNRALSLNYEDYIDVSKLKNEINKFQTNDPIEKIFLSHINIIFEYFIKKQNAKIEIEELNLFNELKMLHEVFEQYMEEILNHIKLTVIIFTILLIIAILLFINYAYLVLKNKIELEKFKNALDISDNIIVITDVNHIIKYVNYGFEKSTGYKAKEVIGKKPSILKSKFLNKDFYDNLNKTIHSGKKWSGEFINKSKTGNITYEKSSITPIKNDKGEIIEFLAVKLDITKEKEYQNVLTQQSKMVSMGELLENIAHQWRQPLSVISSISSGSLIQLDYKNFTQKELKDSFSKIFETTQKLSSTIDDLKNFFQEDEELFTFEVGNSVEKAINLFTIKTEFNQINIEFNKNINAILVGKESEFIQIILNILNNSLDAFIINEVKNKVIKISINQNSEKIQIKISDNAGGVDEDILDKLFDLYFTTKHKSIGTGIGLYMSYQIITQHFKGEIFVKNSNILINKKEYKGLDLIINIPI